MEVGVQCHGPAYRKVWYQNSVTSCAGKCLKQCYIGMYFSIFGINTQTRASEANEMQQLISDTKNTELAQQH
jgi:hypothetical protein